VYHVTTRGNNRERIFAGPADNELLLSFLAKVVDGHGWLCHAYCLMTNHYHLLVQTPKANLAAGMHELNSRYAKAFLARQGRTGHAFERRYHARLIERQAHLLEVCRYIVLNPTRAKPSCPVADWPWSSYRATGGLAARPAFLTTEWVLGNFGTPARARERYRAFVAAGSPAASLDGILLS
jgi:REP element-mobilizing transposase RayT